MFISAFLSPYDELFNIKQNFKMKKYMPLEGLRWSRDSGSTLCDTPQNGRSRTGWGGKKRMERKRRRKEWRRREWRRGNGGGPDVRQKAEGRGRGKWRRSGRDIKNVEPRPQLSSRDLAPLEGKVCNRLAGSNL